jgi:preprotein translocase subunit SecF
VHIILIIFGFTLWSILPIQGERFGRKGFRLGLDLVGGVHLVYQAQFSDNATAADKTASLDRAVLTIQKRIDTFGVTDSIIQRLGEDRVLVQLPGFTDIDAAKKLVETELNMKGTELHAATVVGPAVAGLTYAWLGPGWCFTINGLSFIAVIVALLMMRLKPQPLPSKKRSAIGDIKAGLEYVIHDSPIRRARHSGFMRNVALHRKTSTLHSNP